MSYFQLYEQRKKSRDVLKLGSMWKCIKTTWGPQGRNSEGNVVIIEYCTSSEVFYSYHYRDPVNYNRNIYSRPIDVFMDSFTPVL